MLEHLISKLPHRDPFLLITEVHHAEDGKGSGCWQVDGTEWFFKGHFPGDPVVPGVLVVESLAQLCGIVSMSSSTGQDMPSDMAMRLGQVDVRFHNAVVPPDRIMLEATLVRELGGLYMFDVQANIESGRVARGTIAVKSDAPESRS